MVEGQSNCRVAVVVTNDRHINRVDRGAGSIARQHCGDDMSVLRSGFEVASRGWWYTDSEFSSAWHGWVPLVVEGDAARPAAVPSKNETGVRHGISSPSTSALRRKTPNDVPRPDFGAHCEGLACVGRSP